MSSIHIIWLSLLGVLTGGLFPLGDPSRILVAIPLSSTLSHYMNFRKVMGALTERQHEVTFLMSAANAALSHTKTALDEKFDFVIYEGPFDASNVEQIHRRFKEEITRKSSKDHRASKNLMEAASVVNASTENPWHRTAVECDSVIGNDTLIAALNSSNYDFLIGDPAANLCTPLLAETLSVSFMHYSIQGLRVVHHDRWFGQPIYPSFMPISIMPYCDAMSFWERAANSIAYAVSSLLVDRNILAAFEKVKTKYAIRPEGSLRNLVLNSQLLLVNSDVHVHEFARPLLPNVIPVGGVTAEPAQPLEESLEDFFEGSGQNGVVIIAMGTSLTFDETTARDIAGALSHLKQRVVWVHRGTRPTHIGNNTRIVGWLPNNDALGHPKTKVLVNHGGTSTVLEAIYHGVPMILVPLANDMFDIANRAVCRGVAVRLNMPTLTGTVLVEAIERVVSEPRFKSTSKHFSEVVKAMTPSPLDRAVFWIEHVTKHGADHLRPAVAHTLSFYQWVLLDVLIAGAVCIAVFIKVATRLVDKLFRFAFPKHLNLGAT